MMALRAPVLIRSHDGHGANVKPAYVASEIDPLRR